MFQFGSLGMRSKQDIINATTTPKERPKMYSDASVSHMVEIGFYWKQDEIETKPGGRKHKMRRHVSLLPPLFCKVQVTSKVISRHTPYFVSPRSCTSLEARSRVKTSPS
jgi:hypothetical protein